MAVSVGCYLNRGVAKAFLDRKEVGSLRDHKCGRGVAEIVESRPMIEASAEHSRLEESLVEIVVAKRTTAWSVEDQSVRVGRPAVDVVRQLAGEFFREVDAAAGVGLRRAINERAVDLLNGLRDLQAPGVAVETSYP